MSVHGRAEARGRGGASPLTRRPATGAERPTSSSSGRSGPPARAARRPGPLHLGPGGGLRAGQGARPAGGAARGEPVPRRGGRQRHARLRPPFCRPSRRRSPASRWYQAPHRSAPVSGGGASGGRGGPALASGAGGGVPVREAKRRPTDTTLYHRVRNEPRVSSLTCGLCPCVPVTAQK